MTPDPTTIMLPNQVTLSHVDQGDSSAPAVVLVPGLTDSWRSFGLVLCTSLHPSGPSRCSNGPRSVTLVAGGQGTDTVYNEATCTTRPPSKPVRSLQGEGDRLS